MAARAVTQTLRRRQLDRLLTETSAHRDLKTPSCGWIREIRSVLGMSAAQLATRMGVRQSTVAKMERTEQEETISLQSLRRAAEAMDCMLVYAFVPRQTLEETLITQARQCARRMVARVEHTLVLEAQRLPPGSFEAEVEELTAELIRTLSREIWRAKPEVQDTAIGREKSGDGDADGSL